MKLQVWTAEELLRWAHSSSGLPGVSGKGLAEYLAKCTRVFVAWESMARDIGSYDKARMCAELSAACCEEEEVE